MSIYVFWTAWCVYTRKNKYNNSLFNCCNVGILSESRILLLSNASPIMQGCGSDLFSIVQHMLPFEMKSRRGVGNYPRCPSPLPYPCHHVACDPTNVPAMFDSATASQKRQISNVYIYVLHKRNIIF